MKTVNKKSIDELCRVSRKYGKTGDTDILEYKTALTKSVSFEIYGKENWWMQLYDLIDALCGVRPLKNCTNKEIYKILEMLDIKVVEESEVDSI